jgi:hypothetical protein
MWPVQLFQVADVVKRASSRFWDWLSGGPRRPIPTFETPQAAWDYLAARYTYTGDPLNGALDFYVHPEKFQWGLETGVAHKLSVDCDDVAAWAYVALRQMGADPHLAAIYDEGLRGAHCICLYVHKGRVGAIDTNGHVLLPNLRDETLMHHWTNVYRDRGYVYRTVVTLSFPF